MLEKVIKERMKDLVHPLLLKVVKKGGKKMKNRVCKACTLHVFSDSQSTIVSSTSSRARLTAATFSCKRNLHGIIH